MKTLLDGTFQTKGEVEELPPVLMFRLWLAAGYLYEHRSETLIPDEVFDHLCVLIDARWEEIAEPAKVIVDREALRTSSVHYLRPEDFPPMARAMASGLMMDWHGKSVPYQFLPQGRWAAASAPPVAAAPPRQAVPAQMDLF